MAEWFKAISDRIEGFFDWVISFFTVDIYEFFIDVFAALTKWSIYWSLMAAEFGVNVASEVANDILSDITVNETIQGAWSSLPPEVTQALIFFNFPQAVSMIMGAYITRYAFKFVPGVGA